MDKYKIDYDILDKNINAPKMFDYEEVKDRLRKVAFDVVVFRDSPERLWQIVQGDDGKEYIVARYEDVKDDIEKNSWSVEVDRLQKFATVFYKDVPVTNVNIKKANISDVEDFKQRVPKLLGSDKALVRKMIEGLDSTYRNKLVKLYPEIL